MAKAFSLKGIVDRFRNIFVKEQESQYPLIKVSKPLEIDVSKTDKLYKQITEHTTIESQVEKYTDINEKVWIERNGEVQKIDLSGANVGDILLEMEDKYPFNEFDTTYFNNKSKIDIHNLSKDFQTKDDNEKILIRTGKITFVEHGEEDNFFIPVKIEVENLLSEFAVDYKLVERENIDFSMRNVRFLEKKDNNDKNFEKIMEKGGLVERDIRKTLVINGLYAGEEYKLIDVITIDNQGLNNKLMYAETKKGDIKAFEIGSPFEDISYKKGQNIKLEDVLKNSVNLIEKCYERQEAIEHEAQLAKDNVNEEKFLLER